MSLRDAIQLVNADIVNRANSRPGSTDWYYQQALGLGVSFLRKAQEMKLETPEAVDRFRKLLRKEVIQEGEDSQAGGKPMNPVLGGSNE